MKKILCLILAIMFISSTSLFSLASSFDRGKLPKNVKVISQSSQQTTTYITAIDLDNNELIMIQIFNSFKYICLRTGITCDPNTQSYIQGESAPFKSDSDQ